MSSGRALYHMVRADFLERVRRYSFLLTMAFSIYLGYAVYSGQMTLQLDKYRGVDNSAWLGSVIGLVGSFYLSLVGFYIVKNSIQRDRQTRVGQILATTPISKSFYTISKTLSNFAVLGVMALVLGLAALVIQIFHRGDAHLDLFALEAPVLVFGLSALAVTAALAVLFESLPVLRGGVGNVLYFFLWITLIVVGASSLDKKTAHHEVSPYKDYAGLLSVMSQMQNQLRTLDPTYSDGASFSFGSSHPATKTFLWTGLIWTPALLLSRGMLLALAMALALLAALFFDRFDPARAGWSWQKKPKAAQGIEAQAVLSGPQALLQDKFVVGSLVNGPRPLLSAAHLAPLVRTEVRTRFFALVAAELRLLLRGHAWWWYAGAAGAILGCLFSPLADARSGVIVFAWLWPLLIWSQLGTREAMFSTGSLIFSAPHAVSRQLLATYAAGVMVAAITGGGLGFHLLFARDFAGLGAWAAGALFIPALALALGVTTGSRKFFEALYTAWWYVGPLHHTPQADFMGTTPMSSTPVPYLAAATGLVVIAYVWRTVRLRAA
jgi:ABC-type polysaccharide/polyol phosphate export permease